MKKDKFLEEQLNAYVEGAETPDVDLSAAKRALLETQMRRRSARRRMWIALASACASLVLVAVVLTGILPFAAAGGAPNDSAEAPGQSGSPEGSGSAGGPGGAPSEGNPSEVIRFALSDAEPVTVGVGDLIGTYGETLKKLTNFGFYTDVSADYTLYCVNGLAVLLGTDLLYTQEGSRVTVTVYTDLSGGAYRAEELGEYDGLQARRDGYTYEQRQLFNGEYVSLGNFTSRGAEYCVALQSSYAYAFSSFMTYLV